MELFPYTQQKSLPSPTSLTHENWVIGITDRLQHQFPKSKVSCYNAGIGGTGSQLGILHLSKHVLNYDPDIVFVQFSANDQNSESYRERFEVLIRNCLRYDEDTVTVKVTGFYFDDETGLD